MTLNRRTLLLQLASGAVGGMALTRGAASAPSHRITAVAFDAFPIFDPRPVFQACERLFAGRGAELGSLWRTRQFEYQWLRALGGRYANFWDTTRDALVFAAGSLNLSLSTAQRDELMDGYLQLRTWPDVKPALDTLRGSGLTLAFLSNATAEILESGIRNSGLQGLFDQVISTDRIRTFKPNPLAYRLGVDVLQRRPSEILFVAFAGWDVAGAKWFGYPTFWNNRQSSAREELGVLPDASGGSLDDLVAGFREGQPFAAAK